MSDTVIVALIAGSFNVIAIVVGRLISSAEHKRTAADVREIKQMMNGAEEE